MAPIDQRHTRVPCILIDDYLMQNDWLDEVGRTRYKLKSAQIIISDYNLKKAKKYTVLSSKNTF